MDCARLLSPHGDRAHIFQRTWEDIHSGEQLDPDDTVYMHALSYVASRIQLIYSCCSLNKTGFYICHAGYNMSDVFGDSFELSQEHIPCHLVHCVQVPNNQAL